MTGIKVMTTSKAGCWVVIQKDTEVTQDLGLDVIGRRRITNAGSGPRGRPRPHTARVHKGAQLIACVFVLV